MPDRIYFMIEIRALAQSGQWEAVKSKLTKKCPIPFQAFSEICFEFHNVQLAVDAALRVSDFEERIQALLEMK